MTLSEIRTNFEQRLQDRYPPEELQSFFTILCEDYLNIDRLQLALDRDREVSEAITKKFYSAIERLSDFEPIQYIVGYTDFYGLRFMVNQHVLIPRPETEELVAWIIDDVKGGKVSGTHILDIGTGSGCIAVSLANELEARVAGLDISEEALQLAQQNAKDNATKAAFEKRNVLTTETLKDTYTIMVSNPPYVRASEKNKMEPNVLNHEPKVALFVEDEDPLLFYRKIALLAKAHLHPDGALYFEINEYLSKDLVPLLQEMGFSEVTLRKDIFGKDRMIRCLV